MIVRIFLIGTFLVQTDPSEEIDLPIQEAFCGFLTFLSPIRCPLFMTDQLFQTFPRVLRPFFATFATFATFFVCRISLVVNIVKSCGLIEGDHFIRR